MKKLIMSSINCALFIGILAYIGESSGQNPPSRGPVHRGGCVINTLENQPMNDPMHSSRWKTSFNDFEDYPSFVVREKLVSDGIVDGKILTFIGVYAELQPSNGIDHQNRNIVNLIANMSRIYNINIDNYWYNDDSGINAFATTMIKESNAVADGRSFRTGGKDGSIVFGRTITTRLLKSDNGEPFAITAVLAHELAHVYQFKKKTHYSKIKYSELQADFLAGWVISQIIKSGKLGSVKLEDFDETSCFSTIYKFGNNMFNDPNFHGTKIERLDAFLQGFRGEWIAVEKAYSASQDYVKGIESKDNKPNFEGYAPANQSQ